MHLCLIMGAVSFRRWRSFKKPPYSPRKVYKSHKKPWERRCFIEGRKQYLWWHCFCRCDWHLQKRSLQTAELLQMVSWKENIFLFSLRNGAVCSAGWSSRLCYLMGSMKYMPYVIYFIKLYFLLTIWGACSE